MSIFKKKEETNSCCCSGDCNAEIIAAAQSTKDEGAAVKILGSGCKKCNELEANTKEAMAKLGMEPVVDHVTDFAVIASYGVMTTPALVYNGKVVSYGKVLKTEEVLKLLQKAM